MTATLLTVAELREHVETALGDTAVQRLLDSCEAAIDAQCGVLEIGDYDTPVEITEVKMYDVNRTTIRLDRVPDSITSVTEVYPSSSGDDMRLELLEDDDFWVNGRYLRRKAVGSIIGDGAWAGRWGSRIEVVYTPKDVRAARRSILIQLVKLEINVEPGTGFEGAATWQQTTKDYETEKQHLLWSLCPPVPFA